MSSPVPSSSSSSSSSSSLPFRPCKSNLSSQQVSSISESTEVDPTASSQLRLPIDGTASVGHPSLSTLFVKNASKNSAPVHTGTSDCPESSTISLELLDDILKDIDMNKAELHAANTIEDQLTRQFLSCEKAGDLVLQDVPEKTFQRLAARRSSINKLLRFTYDFERRIFAVRMLSESHEFVATGLKSVIDFKLRAASWYNTVCIGSGAPDIRFGNIVRQPDGCYKSLVTNKYTLTIECGVSESLTQLGLDARHWIEHQDSSVRMCLVLNVQTAPRSIILEIWECRDRSLRTPRRTAVCTQTATMVPDPSPYRSVLVQWQSSTTDPPPTEIRLYQYLLAGISRDGTNSFVAITEADLVDYASGIWRILDGVLAPPPPLPY